MIAGKGGNMSSQNSINRKTLWIVSMIINIFIVVMSGIGALLSFQNSGTGIFKFYTQDSNLFALFACGVCAIFQGKGLKEGNLMLPYWVKSLKYIATTCLMVTFLIVLFVLSPIEEGGAAYMLFHGSMLYTHFICPLSALLSFLLLDRDPILQQKHSWVVLLPTLLYAMITILLNITGSLDGPYPFLRVMHQPVLASLLWAFGILVGAYIVGWILGLSNRKFALQSRA